MKEHIEVEGLKQISITVTLGASPYYNQYHVLASLDKCFSLLDAHLFSSSELLELADWVEENRAQLEQGRL